MLINIYYEWGYKMEQKTHYKMYKAGKNWVFAMLATVALTGIMAMGSNTAKADTVSQNTTEQVAKVDTTSATTTSTQVTTQVEKATNSTNESNTAQTATVTTEQSSSKTATISSNQDNKQAAAASVATSEQNQNAQSTQVANNNEQSNTTQSLAAQKSEEPKVETPVNTANNASQKNVNGNWYLVDNNTGKNLTGFQEIKYQNKVVYYAPSNAQMQYGWQNINNNKYYFDNVSGAMTTGQKYIKGNWYLFDNQGVMQTGFQEIANQNKTAYYNKEGQMQFGQKYVDNHWYLFDEVTGAMQTGFQKIANQNKTVYYNKKGQMQFGQQTVGNNSYLFDKVTGAMQTGFQNLAPYGQNKVVYYASNGQMQHGQKYVDNHWYLFDEATGAMQTGFQNLALYGQNKVVYYASNGQMQFGQKYINKHWYIFDKTTGEMAIGFTNIPDQNKIVYYSEDESKLGQMQFGWQNLNNGRYYLDTVTGAVQKGQKNIGGHWYLFNNKGIMQTGFQLLDGGKRKVYYSPDKATLGQMQYGWKLLGKDHYYFDKITGAMSKGEKNIGGHWYLFNNKGIMQTGFQLLDGGKRKVYYSPDKATLGQMQYGVQIINGNTYYFDRINGSQSLNRIIVGNDNTLKYYGNDGSIVKNNTLNINGKNYSFDGMGSLIGNGQLNIQGHWYLLKNKIVQTGLQNLSAYGENKTVYYASNGQMQYGQQQLNGHWYLFDKISGAMQTGLQNLSAYGENKTVYYASNGQMQYGQQQLNGHWYLFDKISGAMQTGFQNLSAYGENKTVYYASNGQMQYGARKINNNLYFFDTTTGAMYVRNFVNVNGQTYYAGNNGVLMAPRYISQLTPIFAGWGCAVASSAMLMSIKGENLDLWYAYSHEPQAGVFNGVGFTKVISANNLTNYMRQFDGGFRNISGSSIDQIKNLVNSGHPVLYYGYSSYGYSHSWKNHCKVIVGYSNGKFHIYDPCYYRQSDGPNTGGHGTYDLGADQWRTENQLAAEYYGNNGSGAITIY